jgi:hypothetical protein
VKIPKRVNTALDRAAEHARTTSVVLLLVVAAVVAVWLPALAAFAVGIAVGGVAVHARMSRKVARLRAEADDLLRENGALRHQATRVSQSSVTSGAVLTQRLPSIPEDDDR